MKQRITIIALILCVIVTVVFIGIRFRTTSSSADSLKFSGVIEVTTTELSFRIPGRLVQRLVDEGMQIATGQEIGRLDDVELQQERATRLAEEKATRAALADLLAGSRREEIGQGEAALARLQADATKYSQDSERAEELFKREVIPGRELDAARAAQVASKAAADEAAQRLKLLKAGPRSDSVQQAKARLEAASSAVAQADTRLSHALLKSPVTGVVLAKHVEAGEMIAAGAPVVTIGKLDEVWLRGYIPESELGRVKLGQSAQVTFDSWPGRVFEGRVSFIASQAEFTPKNVQTQKERVKLVYRIKISLSNPKGELKPGMPADALIVAEEKKQ